MWFGVALAAVAFVYLVVRGPRTETVTVLDERELEPAFAG